MANLKQLKKVAEELNDVMSLNPPIDVKLGEDELTEKIKEAIGIMEPEDEFTEATQAVIDELKPPAKPARSAKPKKEEVVEEEEEADDEPEEEEEEEEEEEADEDDLTTQVEDAEKLSELKDIAKENDEFKSIRGKLSAYKNASELRKAMLLLLEKPAKKATGKPAKEEKAEKPAKEKKEAKEKGPGVIVSIVDILEKAGKKGITKDEILEKLVKLFPEKSPDSLKATISVQVPYRVNKERWEVVKLEGGRFAKK